MPTARFTPPAKMDGSPAAAPVSKPSRRRAEEVPVPAIANKPRKKRESFGAIRERYGKFEASYAGPDGERHRAPRSFDTTSDARAWLTTQRAAMVENRWTRATPTSTQTPRRGAMLFGEYAAKHIITRRNLRGEPLKGTTRDEYLRKVDRELLTFKMVPINLITKLEVDAWFDEIMASGRRTTAARAYELLNGIMKHAVEDGIRTSNPCSIRGAGNAKSGNARGVPNRDQVTAYTEAIADEFKAFINIAAWGTCRFGELIELRRGDIIITRDAETNEVVRLQVAVLRAATQTSDAVVKKPGAKRGWVIGTTKSEAGERLVTMPKHTHALILEHLERHVGVGDDALLFPPRGEQNPWNTHLSPSTWSDYWAVARKVVVDQTITIHSFRHFSGTEFAKTGATLKEVMARMGHSTMSSAMVYQHAAQTRMDELAEAM